MKNKKWTDADLQTAFEDGCKFFNFKDLKDFLISRRKIAKGFCNTPTVINTVCVVCGNTYDNPNDDSDTCCKCRNK